MPSNVARPTAGHAGSVSGPNQSKTYRAGKVHAPRASQQQAQAQQLAEVQQKVQSLQAERQGLITRLKAEQAAHNAQKLRVESVSEQLRQQLEQAAALVQRLQAETKLRIAAEAASQTLRTQAQAAETQAETWRHEAEEAKQHAAANAAALARSVEMSAQHVQERETLQEKLAAAQRMVQKQSYELELAAERELQVTAALEQQQQHCSNVAAQLAATQQDALVSANAASLLQQELSMLEKTMAKQQNAAAAEQERLRTQRDAARSKLEEYRQAFGSAIAQAAGKKIECSQLSAQSGRLQQALAHCQEQQQADSAAAAAAANSMQQELSELERTMVQQENAAAAEQEHLRTQGDAARNKLEEYRQAFGSAIVQAASKKIECSQLSAHNGRLQQALARCQEQQQADSAAAAAAANSMQQEVAQLRAELAAADQRFEAEQSAHAATQEQCTAAQHLLQEEQRQRAELQEQLRTALAGMAKERKTAAKKRSKAARLVCELQQQLAGACSRAQENAESAARSAVEASTLKFAAAKFNAQHSSLVTKLQDAVQQHESALAASAAAIAATNASTEAMFALLTDQRDAAQQQLQECMQERTAAQLQHQQAVTDLAAREHALSRCQTSLRSQQRSNRQLAAEQELLKTDLTSTKEALRKQTEKTATAVLSAQQASWRALQLGANSTSLQQQHKAQLEAAAAEIAELTEQLQQAEEQKAATVAAAAPAAVVTNVAAAACAMRSQQQQQAKATVSETLDDTETADSDYSNIAAVDACLCLDAGNPSLDAQYTSRSAAAVLPAAGGNAAAPGAETVLLTAAQIMEELSCELNSKLAALKSLCAPGSTSVAAGVALSQIQGESGDCPDSLSLCKPAVVAGGSCSIGSCDGGSSGESSDGGNSLSRLQLSKQWGSGLSDPCEPNSCNGASKASDSSSLVDEDGWVTVSRTRRSSRRSCGTASTLSHNKNSGAQLCSKAAAEATTAAQCADSCGAIDVGGDVFFDACEEFGCV